MQSEPSTPVVALHVLWERRRSLLLWSLALAAVSALYTGFYPSVGEGGEALDAYMANFPEGMSQVLGFESIGTAGGYLASTVYGLLGPALLLVFGIGSGARLVAGQEEDGTLELELTHPVGRRRLLTERLVALWVTVLLLVAVVTVVVVAMVAGLGMDLGLDRILAGSTGLFLLVVAFATVALAVGAATGRRAIGLGVAAGLAVLSYVADAASTLLDGGAWLSAVSPWSWYLGGDPLLDGWDPAGLLLLGLLTLVATAGALLMFDRRDLLT